VCAADPSSRRTPLSASTRVALGTALTLLIGVVLLSVLTYLGMRSRLAAELDSRLVAEVDGYAAAVDDALLAEDLEGATRVYLSARSGGGGSTAVLVVSLADGGVLSNSDVPLESAGADTSLIEDAGTEAGITTLTLGDERWRVAYSTITGSDGEVLGLFAAGLPLTDVTDIASEVALTLFVSGMVVVVIGSFASGFVARTSLRPLREVAGQTARIGESELDVRIADDGRTDEIGTMVTSLNSLLDRLESAMNDQRRFVSDASHELRTPLAIIKGHVELSADDRFDEATREESLAIVTDEIDRMRRLIDDLLTLSRLEGGSVRSYQPLDVGLIANEAVVRARSLGGQDIHYSCRGDAWVLGDPDKLLQVLLNILTNAIRHSPDDSVIEVACRNRDDGDGPSVAITVDDQGEGIPPEELGRVFDRFHRSRGQRAQDSEGSGLGLAIAEKIVEAHGGTIGAQNLDGTGARFAILLPAIEPPEGEGVISE
jgi:signal transduction histidine kinase